jgi:hypothetical protein
MRDAMVMAVQDYLGYWYMACQMCHEHNACTKSLDKTTWLHHKKFPGSSKTVYMGHRRWLANKNDPSRRRGELFDGEDELQGPPRRRRKK